jgi:hypothetical protein
MGGIKMTDEQWKITNDEKAEWYIDKTNEELEEIRGYKQRLNDKIQKLEMDLQKEEEKEQAIIDNRNYYLNQYFSTVDDKLKKKTKTQEKYRLPSGDIVKKYSKPKYKPTDKLTEWVKNNGLDYTKITESVEWGKLKKETELVGDKLIYKPTGEIIEGVDIEWTDEKIEFKEK